ncbi:MAG: hypothetical protein FD120_2759, partial [Gammaproteobacteria bacterium]
MAETNIKELSEQFRGRRFGELVLYHIKQQPLDQLVAAMKGTIDGLRPEIQSVVMGLIDNANPLARKKEFWSDDCGEVFIFITSMTEKELQAQGLATINDELFDIFNIIVVGSTGHCNTGLKFIRWRVK